MSYIRKGFKLFKLKFWNPVQEEAPPGTWSETAAQIKILELCSGGDPDTGSETAAQNYAGKKKPFCQQTRGESRKKM